MSTKAVWPPTVLHLTCIQVTVYHDESQSTLWRYFRLKTAEISPLFFPTLGSFLCFFILEAFKSCYRGHCCYYLSTFNRISHITTAHSLKIMPRNTFSTQRRKLQLDGLRCLLSLRMMNSALLQTFSCKYTRKWRLKETWRARLVPVRLVLAWFPMSLPPIVINEDF